MPAQWPRTCGARRLPSTPTVTFRACRRRGVHADPPRASSARTQKVRRPSACGGDPAFTTGSSVAASDVPGTVEVALGEVAQDERQLAGQASSAGVTSGLDHVTWAPAGQERRDPPLGDVSTTDHGHLPPVQVACLA